MTKAEQRALEAYPVHKIGDQTSDYGEWDINRIERRSFQEGYEQAEKDISFMLENARKGGILEGKAEMMKDAVEGEIGYWNQRGLSIRLDQSLERLGYDEDTKVRIIITKKPSTSGYTKEPIQN